MVENSIKGGVIVNLMLLWAFVSKKMGYKSRTYINLCRNTIFNGGIILENRLFQFELKIDFKYGIP